MARFADLWRSEMVAACDSRGSSNADHNHLGGGQVMYRDSAESGATAPVFSEPLPRVNPGTGAATRRLTPLPASVRATVQMLLDGLAEQAALLGADGRILAANHGWERAAEEWGLEDLQIGGNYLAFKLNRAAEGNRDCLAISKALIELGTGMRTKYRRNCRSDTVCPGREFRLTASQIELENEPCIVVTRQDVTEINLLKRERRSLGGRLLRVQEQERRRVARDLHDSTGQLLVALQLSLMQLKRTVLGGISSGVIAECGEVLQRVQREIRTLSFLSHPPALFNHQLASAVETLVRGFGHRTDLAVEVMIGEIGTISSAVEAVVYRLLQEALGNIYRHAAAKRVSVYLCATGDALHLSVKDDGVGFEYHGGFQSVQPGVGVAGMRERVEELGGRLAIQRLAAGTLLTASIPRQANDR